MAASTFLPEIDLDWASTRIVNVKPFKAHRDKIREHLKIKVKDENDAKQSSSQMFNILREFFQDTMKEFEKRRDRYKAGHPVLGLFTISTTLAQAKVSTEKGNTYPEYALEICSCSEAQHLIWKLWNIVAQRSHSSVETQLQWFEGRLESLNLALKLGSLTRGFEPWGTLAAYKVAEEGPPEDDKTWHLPGLNFDDDE